jgi:hypothetical protein
VGVRYQITLKTSLFIFCHIKLLFVLTTRKIRTILSSLCAMLKLHYPGIVYRYCKRIVSYMIDPYPKPMKILHTGTVFKGIILVYILTFSVTKPFPSCIIFDSVCHYRYFVKHYLFKINFKICRSDLDLVSSVLEAK